MLLNGLTLSGGVNLISDVSPPSQPDPYWNNVSLLLQLTGTNNSTTFTDSSQNNISVSGFGNAKISTAQSKWGNGSLYLDGTANTYINTPNNAGLQMGTGDFTIEAWYYCINPDAAKAYLFTLSPETTGRFAVVVESNVIGYNIAGDGSVPTVGTITANTWNHVAISRYGGIIYAYVNGVMGSTTSNPWTGTTIGPGVLDIGYSPDGTPLNGYVSDFRVTKGVARYNTPSFTPPTGPFPTY